MAQYDSIGKKYIKGQQHYLSKREDWARKYICDHISSLKNKRLLDVGCGAGPDITTYENEGANVFGIDESRIMVAEARKISNKPTQIIHGKMEKMPFEKNYFDVIVSRFAVHYAKKIDLVYEEVHRTLRDNGIMVIVFSNPVYSTPFQKIKKYGHKESISLSLYAGAVRIKFPTHQLNEYLSDYFLRHFELQNIDEYCEYDGENITLPSAMGITARKK